MRQTELYRGLRMQYYGVLSALLLALAIPLLMPAAALSGGSVTRPVLECLEMGLPLLAGAAFGVRGLAVLCRKDRDYRLALAALAAAAVLGLLALAPLPAPLPMVLTAALVLAAIGYIGQLVRVTNRFLRRDGQEKLVKKSRWAVLIPAVGFTCLAVLRWMPEQMLAAWWGGGDDWIAQWERGNFVGGATWILIIACLVAYLNYVTQASQALKYEEIEEAEQREEAEQ